MTGESTLVVPAATVAPLLLAPSGPRLLCKRARRVVVARLMLCAVCVRCAAGAEPVNEKE